jgi:hypothetical protein
MKKAKLLWIIYLGLVGLVAIFFTLFINQGLGGMFSVHDANGKISTFNSYLFLDFSKVENARKTRYERRRASYDEKRKKRVQFNNAKLEMTSIEKMLSVLKNSDELKKIAALAKKVGRSRGAEKKTLAKKLKTLRSDYKEKKSDFENIDARKTAAVALAAKLKKNKPNLSDEEALIDEKNRLKAFIENYERTSAAYERELLKIKKYIDKYRIESILTNATYKKIKDELGSTSTALNVIPKSTVLFMFLEEQIEKTIPQAIGIKDIPALSDNMAYDELAGASAEGIEKEIKKTQNEYADILKKIKKEGANETLNNDLKTKKNALEALREKLKNKNILDIVLNGYTETINKVVAIFKQYIDEVTANVNIEGMPFPNFLTQGVFLGKYAENFPKYGSLVKAQLVKSRMKLAGIHRIEERLFGNDSQISKVTNRKVFGVGEVLKFRLTETELDQFVAGFKALTHNIKFQLEQGGVSSATLRGTSGGGGEAAGGDPTLGGGGDPTLNSGDAEAGANSGGGDPSLGGASSAEAAPAEQPLSVEEKKTVIKLYSKLTDIYSGLAPFFVTGADVKITSSVVNKASRSLKEMIEFLAELKAKHPKIISQRPTDTSEGGTGDTISIQAKYDNALSKIQTVNEFIKQNITKLTSITNAGKWFKRILIILMGLLGGALAYITFKWEREEKSSQTY